MTGSQVEILLVEDNPEELELTLKALRRHNLNNKIRVVRDGAEALEILFESATHPLADSPWLPKVVVLDRKLPRVDGLEVLRRVKSDPRTRAIPVVMLTASREERDIAESYRLGVNSYIVKPVDFEKFADSVQQLGQYWTALNQPPGF